MAVAAMAAVPAAAMAAAVREVVPAAAMVEPAAMAEATAAEWKAEGQEAAESSEES